jgi:proteasome lid subunit RPN8/RPN11
MLEHVQLCLPEESCGLVAGNEQHVAQIYPVTNKLHSPVRFRMEETEQLAAMLDLDENGWEILAIYHSHPAGPDHPSPTDLAEFAYPGVLSLIWSCQAGSWVCRAFVLEGNSYAEEEICLDG